jgi:adenine/guanine phosphoribosyltransferase-like PRPP-binding protein
MIQKGRFEIMRPKIKIAGDQHLETLYNCGGYYTCPKTPDGKRLGPLVGYAGTYEGPNGKPLQFVGDVYANFAKAEPHMKVLKFFARCLSGQIYSVTNFHTIDIFCGAPIGGYSLADELGSQNDWIDVVKAEKKVTALKTATSREQSELVFSRHDVQKGDRCVIVEDVCNNFSTTGKFVQLIQSRGAIVVAIACFLNRSPSVEKEFLLPSEDGKTALVIPVASLVRKIIPEYRQDDPAVAEDVANGNVVWKPKDEWSRLMEAMKTYPEPT